MTRAFSMRVPDEILAAAKQRAHESGTSFTAFVLGAIEARLAAPPLTEIPMAPVLAPRETVSAVVAGSENDLARAVCAHPFRNEFGVCKVCGVQL